MTTVQFTLPDELARQAETAGLLSSDAIGRLLEDALRRNAGEKLTDLWAKLDALNLPPLSEEEIQAEIAAARADLHAADALRR
ncbi:MAG: hypothetical protein QM599_02415 [Pseudoxanthomonas sp.]